MKKFIFLTAIIITSFFCYSLTSAKLKTLQQVSTVRYTAFPDYYPISQITKLSKIKGNIYQGVFDNFISDISAVNNLNFQIYLDDDYIQTIRSAETNNLDIVIGIYADSKLYDDFQIITPSLIDNPVHLVMLPSRIGQIREAQDLLPLKGAIDENDKFNNFVTEQFKKFNIETVSTPQEAYRKLMSGEVDYIFTSYWYGISKIMELGIQDLVAVSQKGLWNMPLFIGISDFSQKKNYLMHHITEYLKNPIVTQKIKERALEVLEEIKKQNQGVVPNSYILQNNNN